MLCTECKKEQEKRIPNEEKENAQPAEKVCSDVHTTLKSKRCQRKNGMETIYW